jgi:hypothetical protein
MTSSPHWEPNVNHYLLLGINLPVQNPLYASVIRWVNEKPPSSIALDLDLFFVVKLHTHLPGWLPTTDHLELQKRILKIAMSTNFLCHEFMCFQKFEKKCIL